MTTTFISTSALSEATRSSLMKLQAKLAEAQKEVTTGRLADVGLSLGFKAGQTVSLRQEHARLQSITDTNGLVASRLDASQAALKALAETAQSFLGQLLAARNSATGRSVIQAQAKAALVGLRRHAQHHVQRGLAVRRHQRRREADHRLQRRARRRPIAQAVASAFATAFGVTQSDPAVANISAADMQTFLDGPFAGLFDPAAWSGTWSAASDQNVRAASPPASWSRRRSTPTTRPSASWPAPTRCSPISAPPISTRRLPGRRRHGRARRRRGGAGHHRRCRQDSASPRSASRTPTTGCRSRSTS